MEWGIATEVITLFLLGFLGVCCATFLAERANTANDATKKVLRRRALDAVLISDKKESDVVEAAEVLIQNLDEVLPVQIFYMPASAEILSVVWTGLTFLSDVMRRQLQD